MIVESATPIIKLTAAVVDYSANICTKTAVKGTKTFEQISLDVVFRITDVCATYLQVDVPKNNYFSTSLNTDARDIRSVRDNFPFTEIVEKLFKTPFV